jgi:sporadic carbohydrate cluster 2OG-Fe(II) oxygenase
MNFLTSKEKKLSDEFSKKGYIIVKVENKNSLNFLRKIIIKSTKKILNLNNLYLDKIHKKIDLNKLNEFRLEAIRELNNNKYSRYHYFNIARETLYALAGNELMMQKNINLSIQIPNDKSSLLPIHSDVWSGDSPYEINLWIPLVNCYKTKSMYILEQKHNENFIKEMSKKKLSSSNEIYNLVKKKIRWLNVKYGEFLIFNQTLPHGNIVNLEDETRWSMNCRFKSFFSPYGDKKIGEFFLPISTRPMTKIGINFKYPFKNK